jgi:predicted nucleotidyltransferase
MNKKPYTVNEIKNRISETVKQYGVGKVYLFGSYARGEAKPDSDIDLCIEKGNIHTLFELSGFCLDIERVLDNKVDVITTTGLTEDFKKQIEQEMELLYG